MVEKLSQIYELKGKTAYISIKSKDILDILNRPGNHHRLTIP